MTYEPFGAVEVQNSTFFIPHWYFWVEYGTQDTTIWVDSGVQVAKTLVYPVMF